MALSPLWAPVARAEERLALVLAASDYRPGTSWHNLPATRADAAAMAARLQGWGFEIFGGAAAIDLPKAEMERRLNAFERRVDALPAGSTVVLYYSGHGLGVDGENWLVPVDARLEHRNELATEAISQQFLIAKLKAGANLSRALILDMCRSAALGKGGRVPAWLAAGKDGGAQGMVARRDAGPPADRLLIAYSSGYGTPSLVNLDGGTLSVFTEEILRVTAASPGDSLGDLMGQVLDSVKQRTRGQQIPWMEGIGRIVLNPARPPPPPGPTRDAELWALLDGTADPLGFQRFVDTYPNSPHAPEARRRQAALSQRPAPPVPVPQPAPSAAAPPVPSATNSVVTDCDRLASHPDDIRRRADGVQLDLLRKQADRAIRACTTARRDFPEEPRFAYLLGRSLVAGDRPADGVAAARVAADRGYAMALVLLGLSYQNGNGVTRDDAEAVKWYRAAADQGDAGGQLGLGFMYGTGRGVPANPAEALAWYRKAAAQGLATAQDNLGVYYRDGKGVARDDIEAVKWFRAAAGQGDAAGQNNLGVMYGKGLGVARNQAEAVGWYRKAAAQGSAIAQHNLGAVYRDGDGVQGNDSEAVKWFRASAEQGNALGQNSLGWMYENGRGVARNPAEAVAWYRKAAAQGNELAEGNLARLDMRP